MKYIFSYRRGQDRTLLVDTVQNNNVKNKKKMHLSELTGEWSAISTRLLKHNFPLGLSPFTEQDLSSTSLLLGLFLNQILEVSS